MFKERFNAGYRIVDSISVGSIEFVLGVHVEKPGMYVTWRCGGYADPNKEMGYCWGNYFNDELAAKRDLIVRALDALEVWHYQRGGVEVDVDLTEILKLGVMQCDDGWDTGFVRYEDPPEDSVRAEVSE